MENHVTRAAVVGTAAAPSPTLAQLRAQLTALTFGSVHLSPDEQLRANHNVFNCDDVAQLTRWVVNVTRELARRAAAARFCYATGEQKQHLLGLVQRPGVTRAVKTKALLAINRLSETEAQALIRQLRSHVPFDTVADVYDLRMAARFRVGQRLSLTSLLR